MATPTVATVTGPMPADRFGFTLVHEHVFLDLTRDVAGRTGALGRRRNLKSNWSRVR